MTISVGQAFERLLGDDASVRVIAWDGSAGGAEDGEDGAGTTGS